MKMKGIALGRGDLGGGGRGCDAHVIRTSLDSPVIVSRSLLVVKSVVIFLRESLFFWETPQLMFQLFSSLTCPPHVGNNDIKRSPLKHE